MNKVKQIHLFKQLREIVLRKERNTIFARAGNGDPYGPTLFRKPSNVFLNAVNLYWLPQWKPDEQYIFPAVYDK